jgi:hypothetical protein
MKKYLLHILVIALVSICLGGCTSSPSPFLVFKPYNSSVFHTKDCKKLSSNNQLIEFSSIQKAIEEGAIPCKLCIGQNTTGLNSSQLSKDTHRVLEGGTINQGNVLKADFDEYLKELRNYFDKVDELKRQREILKKHPDYSSVISELEKAGPLALVDPSREISLFFEMLQTLSEEEKKVLRKKIELDEETSALADILVDERRFQLLERYDSFTARIAGDIIKGISDEEYAQLYSLGLEIRAKFDTIVAMLEAR